MSTEADRQRRTESPVYLLHIELNNVKLRVYRRVLVPASISLVQLCLTIEQAMGWSGHHAHELLIDGQRYGVVDENSPDAAVNSQACVRLSSVVQESASFDYVYDFGDRWEHTIKVERQGPPDRYLLHPLCIDGANACPPEDIGGPAGYIDFVATMGDAAHPRHNERLSSYGKEFHPLAFDLLAVNERLHAIEF